MASTRLLLFHTAIVVGALSAGLEGCRRAEERAIGASSPKKVAAQAAGRRLAPVVEVVEDIARDCRVSASGVVGRDTCKSSGLVQALKRTEREMPPMALLGSYCQHLSVGSPEGKALIARRLARLALEESMRAPAEHAFFKCLADQFGAVHRPGVWRNLAAAVARFGVALGRTTEVLAQLRSHPNASARQAGYRSLWAVGRLRVFAQLRRLVETGPLPDRVAALSGFSAGPQLTAQEAAAVCPLLSRLLSAPQGELVDEAANELSRRCPAATPHLIEAAELQVRRGALRVRFVRALSVAAGFFEHKADPKWLARIVALLQQTISAQQQDQRVQAAALRTLERLDPARARRLARRHRRSKNAPLRRAASQIVGNAGALLERQ